MTEDAPILEGQRLAQARQVQDARLAGLNWIQISQKLRIHVDKCKALWCEITTYAEREQAKAAVHLADASKPSVCRFTVRRAGAWEPSCKNNLGGCHCLNVRRKA